MSDVEQLHLAPVILAGGSGTRFWPRSRRSRAKQVLALDGERTMIQQTVDRLLKVAEKSDVWVITNDLLRDEIARQLPDMEQNKILSEPAARNTAPACALAAFLLFLLLSGRLPAEETTHHDSSPNAVRAVPDDPSPGGG